MTKTETSKIRSKLEKERKRIQAELEILVVEGLPDSDGGRNPSAIDNEASESTELEKRTAQQNRLKSLLIEVERAIQKLDLGTYGICEKCKKAINPARLGVLPQAALCLDCKQKVKPEKGASRVNEYWNAVMPFYDSFHN